MSDCNCTLLSTAYLPPIDYFRVMSTSGRWLLERHENYQKQSYRNRCHIYSASGLLKLHIPVLRSGEKGKQPITDVKIDYSTEWQKRHWRAICSAYKSSPFFDYYQDDLYPFFSQRVEKLFDFNLELLQVLLNLLGLPPKIGFTAEYAGREESLENASLYDFRNIIHPKKASPLSRRKNGRYHQVFAHKYGFIDNLSVIDLLFNQGPEAILYLESES